MASESEKKACIEELQHVLKEAEKHMVHNLKEICWASMVHSLKDRIAELKGN